METLTATLGAFRLTLEPIAVPQPPAIAPASPSPVAVTYAPPSELWIAPADAASAGVGTRERPRRVISAEDFDTALADATLMHNETRQVPTLCLYPGEYRTRGAWAAEDRGFDNASWIHLVGAGSRRTTLSLVTPVDETEGKRRTDLQILRGRGQGLRLEGITLDGRSKDLPGYTITGVYYWGDFLTFRDVVVVGVRGDYATDAEAFGIATNGNNGGTLVEDCRVICHDRGAYLSAFSIGHRPLDYARPNPIAGSIVSRCVAVGDQCHFAFGACHETTFRDCEGTGFAYGFYNDFDQVAGVRLDGCRIRPNYSAVHLVYQVDRLWTKRALRVDGCAFDYLPGKDPTAPAIGLGLIEKLKGGPQPFGDVQITRCRFAVPEGRKFYAFSTDAAAAPLGVLMLDNVLPAQVYQNGRGPFLGRNLTPAGVAPAFMQ